MSFSLQIGLTMRVVEAQGYAETRDALAQDWSMFMGKVLPEALWMPLPNIGKAITKYVHDWKLNGFIITGGNNLFEYPGRDETELALIQFALDNSLPVFGVCRGLQIMAHYFEYEISPCTGHAGTRHEISLSLARKHAYFLESGTSADCRFRHIVEMPLFVRSELSEGIQAADMCSYNIYHTMRYQRFDYEYFKKVFPLLYNSSNTNQSKVDGLKIFPDDSPLIPWWEKNKSLLAEA